METKQSITAELVSKGRAIEFDKLPEHVKDAARLCVLDWFGVALGGLSDDVTQIVLAQAEHDGGRSESTLMGTGKRVPIARAALVNGTASHALDYDDVHSVMNGHPTAPVLPAALAAAEATHASGRDFMTAFAAGFETEVRIGALVYPNHYRRGFHATATIGSFGAAMAVARLLKLDQQKTEVAMGIAGTQAAGLKSMFGTMCKPFHAGKAAENGVTAASLAARGLTGNRAVLETRDGFAATHSDDLCTEAALADPDGGYHLPGVLFKYYASCYRTHATIEAAQLVREQFDVKPEEIGKVVVRIAADSDSICNIQEPQTGLQLKFSLRGTTALALLREDMSSIDLFQDLTARRADVIAIRDRVTVDLKPDWVRNYSEVEVALRNGKTVMQASTVGVPEPDRELLRRRLETKFLQLATPLLGEDKARAAMDMINNVDALPSLDRLMNACTLSH